MNTQQILYWVYFFLTAFSLGTMGFAGCLNAIAIRQFKLGFNSIAFYRVLMSLGYTLAVGTLLWVTLPNRATGLYFSGEYVFYTGGLFLAGIGALGLSWKNIDVHVRMEYRQSDLELGDNGTSFDGSMSEETLDFNPRREENGPPESESSKEPETP